MAITLDLYAVHLADESRFLAVSRDRNSYVRPSRYENPEITYAAVEAVLSFYSSSGFITLVPGYLRRDLYEGMGQSGKRTRIRATGGLVDLGAKHGVSIGGISFRADAETIRLKGPPLIHGGPKPLIDYDDTDQTHAMRQRLDRVNALLAETRIVLPEDGGVAQNEADPDQDEERPESRDRSLNRLYRVFNDGSFDRGGRFYGGWWQGLGKDQRQLLQIDGEAIVELDFASMHPRLCYELSGLAFHAEKDPYSLEGEGLEVPRDLVKRAFNQLLNNSGGSIKTPPGVSEGLPEGINWKRLLAMIEDQHEPVAHWFRKGRGVELQAIDAAIADSTLYALAMRDIPCLPIHDSFLVAARFEVPLAEAMILAYQAQLGRFGAKRALPVIKGLSSPDLEKQVISRLSALEVRH